MYHESIKMSQLALKTIDELWKEEDKYIMTVKQLLRH